MMSGSSFKFESGVNLYHTVSNLATIPQQSLSGKERKALRDKQPIQQPAKGKQPNKSGD